MTSFSGNITSYTEHLNSKEYYFLYLFLSWSRVPFRSPQERRLFLTKQMKISISTPTVFISILSSSHQLCYSTLKSAKITTKPKWFDMMKTIPNYMRSRAPYDVFYTPAFLQPFMSNFLHETLNIKRIFPV